MKKECVGVDMKIAIAGKAGSGKSTAANYLVEHGFNKRGLADKLKAICSLHQDSQSDSEPVYLDAYDKIERDVRDLFPEFEFIEWKEATQSVWEAFMAHDVVDGKNRSLLQYVGTDILRSYNDTVWVDYLIRTATDDSRVVIDDVRFKNEFFALKQDGWTMVYCFVPDDIRASRLNEAYGRPLTEEEANHPSENDLDDIPACEWDWILNTGGLIETEEQQVAELLSYLHNNAISPLWPSTDEQV